MFTAKSVQLFLTQNNLLLFYKASTKKEGYENVTVQEVVEAVKLVTIFAIFALRFEIKIAEDFRTKQMCYPASICQKLVFIKALHCV